VLDDGSTDNTTAVVGDFIKQDERIQLVSLRHHGPWVTKNHGLCCARGHFTTFIDSDDEYLASHLERRAAYLARHSTVDLIHGGLEIIGDQYVVDKDDISKKIHLSQCVVGGTIFTRQAIFKQVKGFKNLSFASDADLVSRCQNHGMSIRRVFFPTYRYYRTTPDSITIRLAQQGV